MHLSDLQVRIVDDQLAADDNFNCDMELPEGVPRQHKLQMMFCNQYALILYFLFAIFMASIHFSAIQPIDNLAYLRDIGKNPRYHPSRQKYFDWRIDARYNQAAHIFYYTYLNMYAYLAQILISLIIIALLYFYHRRLK